MSLTLSNVEQEEFDNLVKMEYFSLGFLLRDCVYTKSNVTGLTCQFRKVGELIANLTGWQQPLAMDDPGFTAHTATLQKWVTSAPIDEIQELTVNFSSKEDIARCVAHSIGRRSDQLVIDELETQAGRAGANLIAHGGTNMSYSKLRNVVQIFEENAVPLNERYIAMSGNNLRALLASDQIISRFYTSNDAVATGSLNHQELLGMSVRIIPTMSEGGLTIAANIRDTQAWAKRSIGMAIGQDLRTEVNYLPEKTSWLVAGILFAGAVAIDGKGIIQITCDESVNP